MSSIRLLSYSAILIRQSRRPVKWRGNSYRGHPVRLGRCCGCNEAWQGRNAAEPGLSHLGQRVSATGCRIGCLRWTGITRCSSWIGRTRERTGTFLSHAVPFFPIQSHISHSKAAISPDSKLKGRSPDVPERKLLVTCTILSRFVPPGPRGSAERATAVCGECRDGGAFGHWCHTTWCHTTMVRMRHEAWQVATVINCPNAIALVASPLAVEWSVKVEMVEKEGRGWSTFKNRSP